MTSCGARVRAAHAAALTGFLSTYTYPPTYLPTPTYTYLPTHDGPENLGKIGTSTLHSGVVLIHYIIAQEKCST